MDFSRNFDTAGSFFFVISIASAWLNLHDVSTLAARTADTPFMFLEIIIFFLLVTWG
ncbi:putative membrane protein [Escherichia coli 07798]|nr:putative membrane protein [Escherichia coli OK1180]EKI37919.1 putative membrane protein [Escherichia coli 07798]